MTPRPRRRRLVFRVYALTAALAVAIMAALLLLPRYTRAPRYLEPQAALIQYLVDRMSLKDHKGFMESFGRIEARLRGQLTLFDPGGHVLASTEPPLVPPTDNERDALTDAKWSLTWDRIVVYSDDRSVLAVYAPNRPSFPWTWVLPIGAIILIVVGAASLWFSRRLAQPLEQLADAARRFGAGDTDARASLSREDELGDLGRAFDDMAARTSALLLSQRQLMADVSHELRTPLARIRVALELVNEDPVAARDVLADVTGDLDEIDQLIEDILVTARLDAGSAPLTRRPVRVSELTNKATSRFKARHPNRILTHAETAQHANEIECDPMLLRRALDNLLDYAAKYSEPGTPLVLDVLADRGGKGVAFAVVDKGIGMSVDDLERAFTPFWRADSSRTRRTGGFGLGLALARRIARAHGGDVTLASTLGEGIDRAPRNPERISRRNYSATIRNIRATNRTQRGITLSS